MPRLALCLIAAAAVAPTTFAYFGGYGTRRRVGTWVRGAAASTRDDSGPRRGSEARHDAVASPRRRGRDARAGPSPYAGKRTRKGLRARGGGIPREVPSEEARSGR